MFWYVMFLSSLPILGHLPMLLNKKNSLRMGEFHADLKVSSSILIVSTSHLDFVFKDRLLQKELGPIYKMETPAETLVK